MRSDYRLSVLWDGELAGYITPARNGGLTFAYARSWLESVDRPISLSLPCSDKSFDEARSIAFFENLLPEGEQYQELCSKARLSPRDIYGFLEHYGKECAGAIVVANEWEADEPLQNMSYRDVTEELEYSLAEDILHPQTNLISKMGTRLSIAGAQNKLPVLWKDGRFFVPETDSFAPTNAILKPASSLFPDLHKNELFCMRLARAVGLEVSDASLVSFGKHLAYVVKRYDRVETENGTRRLHQEDFCQALGVNRVHKYEENKGPGFADCGRILLRPEVVDAAGARDNLIRCALFNYLIGNCDAHAKNFSLIHEKDAGIRLAPFYDLVSTRAYPNISPRFAMAIGKAWEYEEVNKDSWRRFAKSLSVRDKLVFRLMDELVETLTGSLENVYGQFMEEYGPSRVCADIKSFVEKGIEKFRDVITS